MKTREPCNVCENGMLFSRCSDCPKAQSMAVKECSQHPNCQGPSLVKNHAILCPDHSGDDCDNDHCWVPCVYCIDPDDMTKH